ncbi:MAG TPA: hypothetical protein DEQ34_09150 [Balneolaceae bacterium]|nr:hypothetical protein [Balneolaceae bacterium]
MAHKLNSILLLIIFLAPAIVRIVIIADFKVNQDYIAEAFCVFRAEPENDCKGMCYLDEQLDKTDDPQEKEQDAAIPLKTEILQYLEHEIFELEPPFFVDNKRRNTCSPSFYTSTYLNRVFHPPQFS